MTFSVIEYDYGTDRDANMNQENGEVRRASDGRGLAYLRIDRGAAY
ncbi:MAG: hypothetical protein ACC682_14205 [Gemmatimonadota bacterium]